MTETSTPARLLRCGTAYAEVEGDPYTPTTDQVGELDEHIRDGPWGDTPAQFIEWFAKLWSKGDPSEWGAKVFTTDAVMLDPVGRSIGAETAAADFELLFHHFPDLRADVVSWARNDREILINWRFRVQSDLTCPVVDKFSFRNGLVSFRQAYFDPMMLLGYLARHYGFAPFIDYYQRRFLRGLRGGGVLFLPRILLSLAIGYLRWPSWPLRPPEGFSAELVRTCCGPAVRLAWEPVEGAASYRIRRSCDGGPFEWLGSGYVRETSYLDGDVAGGCTYRYVVGSNRLAEEPLPPLYGRVAHQHREESCR